MNDPFTIIGVIFLESNGFHILQFYILLIQLQPYVLCICDEVKIVMTKGIS